MNNQMVNRQEMNLEFTEDKISLLKQTVCKGASNDELNLFLHVCKHTGLDPFLRQIYSISRGAQRTIQTSIDGFRLIADRTKKYMPGREPTFTYDSKGKLLTATSYIKKMGPDGSWHEVSASAHFNEYNPGNNKIWDKMPHVMLSKCAETLVIRKSFPADLSGIYSDEEMHQAGVEKISHYQAEYLQTLLNECNPDVVARFNGFLKQTILANSLLDLPISKYEMVKELLKQRHAESLRKKDIVLTEYTIDESVDESVDTDGEQ